MHLSISAQFSLKDRPEDYRGLTSEHITWAKRAALPFFQLARYVLGEILDWYSIYAGAEDLAQERDKLVEWLQGIRFVEPGGQKGDSDGKGVC